MNALNIDGERFGNLVVLRQSQERKNGSIYWECLCDCGKTKSINGTSLKSGKTKACGCRMQENPLGKKYNKLTILSYCACKGKSHVYCKCDCGNYTTASLAKIKIGGTKSCGCLRYEQKPKLKHGMYKTPEFNSWQKMIARCLPSYSGHKYYYDRGIRVDDCFMGKNGFERFYQEVGPKPTPTHSIDRIQNNLGYASGNIRWATKSEQAINRRKTLSIENFSDEEFIAEAKRRGYIVSQ
jgi:hypothetical protein